MAGQSENKKPPVSGAFVMQISFYMISYDSNIYSKFPLQVTVNEI